MLTAEQEQTSLGNTMLTDKVAIVTGASRGIGQAIALEFAKQDAKLILSASSMDNLTETENAIKELKKENYILTQANVSIGDEVNEVVKKALDTYGKVDILVNVAGMTKDNLLAMMPEKDWDSVLSTKFEKRFLIYESLLKTNG